MTALIALLPLSLASLVGSGILFRHQRLLTYLAAAGALFEAQWLVLTLLQRVLLPGVTLDRWYGISGMVLLVGWALSWRRFSLPYRDPGSGRRDIVPLVVTSVVILGAVAIASVNGFTNNEWVTHGFYNGDTVTLVSLVQRSLLTPGLVKANVFAANGYLEYPTLVHAAVANFLTVTGTGLDWLRLLPILTYAQLFITVPLFFLLWDVVWPEPKRDTERWFGVSSRSIVLGLQGLLTLYLLGSSWDNYVYPQSHFFLTALFLLLTAVLIQTVRSRGREWGLAWAQVVPLTIVLLLSNAVTGTAAVACTASWLLFRLFERTAASAHRLAAACGILLLLALFFAFTPGDSAFGLPHFSYTAAFDLLRWTPFLALLLAGIWYTYEQHSYPALAAVVLCALAGVTFFFSTRDIVVANASRFIYHAGLVAWPLVLPPIIRLTYLWRRQWWLSTRTLPELAIGWLLLLTIVGGSLLLPLASIASAHDHLMRSDKQVVGTGLREALWWVEDHTAAESIILASPYPPFAVPLFTGRALVRTVYPEGTYWLSPDDETLASLRTAFTGDKDAQEEVLTQADYVLLSASERSEWEPLSYEKVFDSNAYVIYKLR